MNQPAIEITPALTMVDIMMLCDLLIPSGEVRLACAAHKYTGLDRERAILNFAAAYHYCEDKLGLVDLASDRAAQERISERVANLLSQTADSRVALACCVHTGRAADPAAASERHAREYADGEWYFVDH